MLIQLIKKVNKGPIVATAVVAGLIFLAAIHAEGGAGLEFASRSSRQDTDQVSGEEVHAAAEGAVFLLRPQENELIGVSLADGQTVSRIQLDSQPRRVVPTPGGVSVFVLFENSDVIEVYSAENFERQQRIKTDLGSLRELSFSPDGSRVWVVSGDGSTVTEFSHSMLELTAPRTVANIPGRGPVLPNRRATRLYRGGSDAIHVLFGQTLQPIEELGDGLYNPVFEPGFSELWGVTASGQAVAVDERSGAARLQQAVPQQTAVVTDRISYLSEDGKRILQYLPRRDGDPLQANLETAVVALARGSGRAVWAISQDGQISEVLDGRVVAQWQLDDGNLTGITDAIASVVRRDGSFACF